MKKNKVFFVGMVALLLTVVLGTVYAYSGQLEDGLYVKESRRNYASATQEDKIEIFYSGGDVIVAYHGPGNMNSNSPKWEKRVPAGNGRIHLSGGAVLGSGAMDISILSSTSFNFTQGGSTTKWVKWD
ncbi:hypothetical protein AGMMS49940_05570 [Spirochaetia bacterium]|nr:hypothetical protein AGMMS49940_05570 [Spirochaetia bacterium]